MALVNEHLMKLPDTHLPTDIVKRVNSYKITHPKADIIHLETGDVTLPVPSCCVNAMKKAVEDFENIKTFHGYSPIQGYPFLIETILKHEYKQRGITLDDNEVFISDGAKSDIGNIGDILRHDNSIGLTSPVFPTYIDSNASVGRAGVFECNKQWSNVIYIPCLKENNFIPSIPKQRIDIIYLCHPNNPTGATLNRNELKKWIQYAIENDTLILFDATYEAYIRHPEVPHSIYEIKGAKKVAIEFRSFSKTAGFTGIRCGFTVIPKDITAATLSGTRIGLNMLWNKRQQSRSNGVSYISQRGAEAIYTADGKEQVRKMTDYYMDNAILMRRTLQEAGLYVNGGENAPFLWVKTPGRLSSWDFFEHLLYKANVICTPGTEFGPQGEGYIRLTAFNERSLCEKGVLRIVQSL